MTQTTDRAKLRKDNPSTWIAVTPGDEITGDVADIAAAWSDTQYDGKDPDSGFYPLLRLRVQSASGYTDPVPEVLTVHCFAAVLQSRVLELEPAPGETVTITYEGTGEAKQRGRNAPELYRLLVHDRDPAETAKRVYSQLAGKRRGAGPRQAAEPEGDVPIDTEGLG